MADEYANLTDLKAWMAITVSTFDTILQRSLDAAHEAVNDTCGRRFYLDSVVSARSYRPSERIAYHPDGGVLVVDDIGTTTGLIVETGITTFTAVTGTVETQPENAIARGRAISSLLLSNQSWPTDPYTRVRVTAKWGWPAVPARVKQATLIQAARWGRRKDSLDGVLGGSEFGVVRVGRVDADVEQLLGHFVIAGFG